MDFLEILDIQVGIGSFKTENLDFLPNFLDRDEFGKAKRYKKVSNQINRKKKQENLTPDMKIIIAK